MNSHQLLDRIIRPALRAMGPRYDSDAAAILLLATAAQESKCGEFVHQVGGPALGPFQMEPFTHHDLVCRSSAVEGPHPDERLVYDWRYATQMARVKYYLDPAPLPAVDVKAMWAMYKRVYNTPAGAATEPEFRKAWADFVQPLLTESES